MFLGAYCIPTELKGQCHEIFAFKFFLWISFPQAPEYTNSQNSKWKDDSWKKIWAKISWHRPLKEVSCWPGGKGFAPILRVGEHWADKVIDLLAQELEVSLRLLVTPAPHRWRIYISRGPSHLRGFCNYILTESRVADPHWFNADPDTDPDPAFFLIADPDPGFDDLKFKKMYRWKFNLHFLDQKLQFTYP